MAQRTQAASSLLKSPRSSDIRGSAILTALMFLGVFALFFAALSRYSTQMLAQNTSGFSRAKREEVLREMNLIFSNRNLCLATLRLNGNRFSLSPVFEEGTEIQTGLLIKNLSLKYLGTEAGFDKAEFTANFQYSGEAGAEGSVTKTVYYMANLDGSVSQCFTMIDPERSCRDLGAEWLAEKNRCNFCPSLGGTWNGLRCVI